MEAFSIREIVTVSCRINAKKPSFLSIPRRTRKNTKLSVDTLIITARNSEKRGRVSRKRKVARSKSVEWVSSRRLPARLRACASDRANEDQEGYNREVHFVLLAFTWETEKQQMYRFDRIADLTLWKWNKGVHASFYYYFGKHDACKINSMSF